MATTASIGREGAEETARGAPFEDGYYWSHDGLRLHYRDYPGPADGGERTPVLCIPGLTRNARDFEAVAARIALTRRVLAIDLRGRGESAYAADPLSYVPLSYVQDVALLLDTLGLQRVVAVGTSLGGIVTMVMGAVLPGRIAGAMLNDVGPDIDPEGLERIKSYVGQGGAHLSWVHAARRFAELADPARFPGYALADWLRLVKRTHRVTAEGRIVADYDARIAEPFRIPGGETGFDMWQALTALADVPVTVVRGEHSDILSSATATAMVDRLGFASVVTVPGVGHAPTLEEAEAEAAIDALLNAVDARESRAQP